MTANEAQQRIAQHSWWSEECPGKWQYCYFLYSFAEYRMYFHPDYLSMACLTVRNGYTQEKTPSDERLKVYAWLKERYQGDHRFIDGEHERWVVVRDELLALIDRVVRESEQWGKEELLHSYQALLSRAIDSVRWGTFIECIDDYNSFVLPQRMAEDLSDIAPEERTRIMMTLATPLAVSFMEEFQAEKAKLLLQYRDTIKRAQSWKETKSDALFRHDAERFCERYQWISVNYAGSPALTPSKLFEQLRSDEKIQHNADCERLLADLDTKIDRLAIEQATVMSQAALTQDLVDDFSIMRAIGAWMDERKESMVRTTHALSRILDRIAEVTCVSKSLLEWYTKEEVHSLLTNGTTVRQAQCEARAANAVFMTQWDGESPESTLTIFTGDDATLLYRALNAESRYTLKGIVASRGSANATFSGIVQVVTDVNTQEFISGHILVTSMTRPEFVPLMKHAAAIITDEGGITSHAAVISRELGIPCIIGTQHASKMLKNGDRVEIDFSSGHIRLV